MPRKKHERYHITLSEFKELEYFMLRMKPLQRYSYVRQWLSGRVLDCGCGTGYGSYMIQMNPDVKYVKGIDISDEAIYMAKREYQAENLEFSCEELNEVRGDFDWLVAVEVIEHLEKPGELVSLAERVGADNLLISYPSKKTTHYNPYHLVDYTDEMVEELFPNFELYKTYDFHGVNETQMMFFRRKSD